VCFWGRSWKAVESVFLLTERGGWVLVTKRVGKVGKVGSYGN
jgi:hypothetical protein